jgi:hypothetical protein
MEIASKTALLVKLAKQQLASGKLDPELLQQLQERYASPQCAAEEQALIVELDRNALIPHFGVTKLPPLARSLNSSPEAVSHSISPAIQSILAQIQHLQKQWLALQKDLNPERKAKIDHKLRIEWNTYSNNIEGNTYTLAETDALVRTGKKAEGKTEQEHRDIVGHDAVYTGPSRCIDGWRIRYRKTDIGRSEGPGAHQSWCLQVGAESCADRESGKAVRLATRSSRQNACNDSTLS